MELIEDMTFPIMGMAAKEELNQISAIIGSHLGNDKKEEFLMACENLDTRCLNSILDQTVEALTGFSSVHDAMINFIEKFPSLKDKMRDEFSKYHFEYEQTQVFEHYYSQMKAIMKGEYHG